MESIEKEKAVKSDSQAVKCVYKGESPAQLAYALRCAGADASIEWRNADGTPITGAKLTQLNTRLKVAKSINAKYFGTRAAKNSPGGELPRSWTR